MNLKRPETGELVWIEYQGRLQHVVYISNSDVFMLGDGTRIAAQSIEWFADLPDGKVATAETRAAIIAACARSKK